MRELKLPTKNTIFGLLKEKEQTGRKARIYNFFFAVIDKWPDNEELKHKIGQFWEDNKDKIDIYDDNTPYEEWLTFLNEFNHDNDLKKVIRVEARITINELSSPNDSDSLIIKDLKETAQEQEHQEALTSLFDDAFGGVIWMIFLVDTIKDFYYDYLPTIINSGLNKIPTITLNDLNADEWKKARNDFYTDVYGTCFSTEKESDLNELKSSLREDLYSLENIVNDAKNKNKGGKSKYLDKLLEIYKTQIANETNDFLLNNLRLDESKDINPAYYNKDYFNLSAKEREEIDESKSYTLLLDNLKGESDPKQVKDAFRIVALICATDKAQNKSNEWINPETKQPIKQINKGVKNTNLNTFKNVKTFWERNIRLAPTEPNNPLYLPIIEKKDAYKKQLEDIIQLWQSQK